MTKFYFVRHGQTEWNLERRFQGGNGDSELLPSSYADMKKVGLFLREIQFEHIYASPIRRARITAINIAKQLKYQPKLSLRSNLGEVGLGEWEGKLVANVKERYPASFDNYRNHLDQFEGKEFGGEGYTKAEKRFVRFIKAIAQKFPESNILIVSHGMELSFGLNGLLKKPRMSIRERGGLSNTSTTILSTNDGENFVVEDWNNTSYLNKRQDDSTTI
ncbi:phosphoglycerate mutase [Leuconostoc litchii]|uniref:Histidine phosphatase family protein n=1 Tax=Leuconostoc litchii TaxID=1981069 RepID=A0A6P2CQ57_9LACO|nr:histidine phosphatase family protein [Leuconostoc litchii]TYC47242.1 histidine phosphatase family protein [Leuconostoc litchii]GMA69225.1 phosphoglycerate mutase [Leuconostoc litchii]